MEINDFFKKVKIPGKSPGAKKQASPKEDEMIIITRVLSDDGDVCVVDNFGVPYGLEKKDIVDVEALEGHDLPFAQEGKPARLIVKKDAVLHSRQKIKAGDLCMPCCST